MANPPLRLVTQCANLAEFVRVFRSRAASDSVVVPSLSPAPGAAGVSRVVIALANRAAILDGDAEFSVDDQGRTTIRFTRLDVRSRGLLTHLIEAAGRDELAAIPRHLVPLGAPVGDLATAREGGELAACVVEVMGAKPGEPSKRAIPALPTLRGRPSTAPPPTGAPVVATVATVATTPAPTPRPPVAPASPPPPVALDPSPPPAPPSPPRAPTPPMPIAAPVAEPVVAAIAPAPIAPASIAPPPIAPAAIAPASIAPPEIAPASIAPPAIAPASIAPPAISPASIAPASIAPAPVAPASIAPPAISPASIAPPAIAPASIAPPAISPASIAPPAIAPPAIAPAPAPIAPAVAQPAPVAPAPPKLPPSPPPAGPRRRRDSAPTLLGVAAPRLPEMEGGRRAARGPQREDYSEPTLHGPAPVRSVGDFTTPDNRVPIDSLGGVTLRTRAAPEPDTGETDTGETDAGDPATDVVMALPDSSAGFELDPIAEPPAPSSMAPANVAYAVSKSSAVPRPIATAAELHSAGAAAPQGSPDVAVTAPMSAPHFVDAPPMRPAPPAAAPPREPGAWAPPVWSPTPGTGAPAAAPMAAPPPMPMAAPPPMMAPPPPMPMAAPPPPPMMPAPSVVVAPMPMAAPPPAPGPGWGAPPPMAPPPVVMPPMMPPPAAPPRPVHPSVAYPTAQMRALDYPAPSSSSSPPSSWRNRPVMNDEGGDMTEIISVPRPRRRRWPVIAITSAVIVVIALIALIAATSGSGGTATPPPSPSPSKPAPTKPAPTKPASTNPAPTNPAPTNPAPSKPGAAPAAAATKPAASPASTAAAEPGAGPCSVAFTSSPDGAEVVLDGKVVATTPQTVELPCSAARVTFRRERYQATTLELALKPGAQTVDARLERPTFKVTITSKPPKAEVTIDGRVVGTTPVQVDLLGFDGTSIVVTKPGFAPQRERVVATASGQRVDVRLRRR